MCDSIMDGGKRCACDTRGPYLAVVERLTAEPSTLEAIGSDTSALRAIQDHASTSVGAEELRQVVTEMEQRHAPDVAAYLYGAGRLGLSRSDALRDVKTQLVERKKEVDLQSRAILKEILESPIPARSRLQAKFTDDGMTYRAVLIEFASRPEGRATLESLRDELQNAGFGRRDTSTSTILQSIIARGRERQTDVEDTWKELDRKIAKADADGRRARGEDVRSNYLMMKPNPDVLAGRVPSFTDEHPDLVDDWHPDNPCTPDQMAATGSCQVLWRCKNCGYTWPTQMNDRANTPLVRTGRYARCHRCAGREKFANDRQMVRNALLMYHADPEAFDRLPQAFRDKLLIKWGIKKDSDLGRGLIRGTITMKDIVESRRDVAEMSDDVGYLAGTEQALLDDADRELTDDEIRRLAEEDANTIDGDATVNQQLDHLLGANAFISMMDPEQDAVFIEQLVNAQVQQAWNVVHNNPGEADAIMARIERDYGSDNPVAERFRAQLAEAQAFDMPEGWNPNRTDKDGNTYQITPFLTQKQFALTVGRNRRVGNWSGTGAGKTVSAILAAHHADAKTIVVFSPAAVDEQWGREWKQAFPDTEIRMGMPPKGHTFDDIPDGKRVVYVVSYGALSHDSSEAAARMKGLQSRVDAVIFDEGHMIKEGKTEKESSDRRRMLNGFMKKATENNDQLVVITMTATPVVTSLDEAKSLHQLTTGKTAVGFGTKPTTENALDAHRAMSALGVRYMPDYLKKVDREEIVVSLSDEELNAVAQSYIRMSKGRKGANPSVVERALLKPKLPAIAKKLRDIGEPTLIYSEYTTGMVSEMAKHLRESGLRVETFTGEEQDPKKRDAMIQRFRRGEIDVLIGSRAVGTGIDGLQDACNNLIVVSPPWTASQEDQVVGRLARQGQTERVKVWHVVSEADLGNGATWSYDRDRVLPMQYRRGIADTVTEGVTPQGHAADVASLVSRDSGRAFLAYVERLTAQLDSNHASTLVDA